MKMFFVMISVFFSVLLLPGCRNGYAASVDTSTSSRDRDASVTASRILPSTIKLVLWRLRYRTPTSHDSPHPLARERPTSVALLFFHERSRSLREVTEFKAPSHAVGAWTVNILVTLPSHVRPFFNFENRYATRDRFRAAQTENDQEALRLQGTLQMWRVQRDGHQDLSSPGIGCLARSRHLETRDCFFVPHLVCPHRLEECRLGAHECCDWYELPL